MHGQPPIVIEPYDPAWPEKFESEKVLLEELLKPWLAGPVEHIGSTSVPGIPAKPIIDIAGPVFDLESSLPAIEAAAQLSYCYFPYKPDQFHWFCKPSDVERTHHFHLVPIGAPLWKERLFFRDYLRSHPEAASDYADLKFRLAELHREDREAYTDAKTEFIEGILALANR
mgnify:CR=1 FL=1